MELDERELLVGELARLVDDLVGHADLADVVQQRGELEVAPAASIELEGVADRKRERDDAVAVLTAGVGVVGLEQVAHEQSGAAVGVRERERLVDVRAPLAREECEQAHDRQHERHCERLALARHAGEDADRGERGVDREHPDERAQLQLRRHPRGQARSRRPVKPASKSACTPRAKTRTGQSSRPDVCRPQHRHDQRRPDRVPGVREHEHGACRVDITTHVRAATARSADRPRRAAAPAPAEPG